MKELVRFPTGGQGIRVGGSELLLVFLDEAIRLGPKRLHVLAPYVDDAAFDDDAFRHSWDRLLRAVDATIVVRTTTAAEAILRSLARRRSTCDLRINPRLHGKVFVAHRAGAEVAMAGSHNLTGAALHTNQEIGILIKPGGASDLRDTVRHLLEATEAVARQSPRYFRPEVAARR
jgi:hypothetical protein